MYVHEWNLMIVDRGQPLNRIGCFVPYAVKLLCKGQVGDSLQGTSWGFSARDKLGILCKGQVGDSLQGTSWGFSARDKLGMGIWCFFSEVSLQGTSVYSEASLQGIQRSLSTRDKLHWGDKLKRSTRLHCIKDKTPHPQLVLCRETSLYKGTYPQLAPCRETSRIRDKGPMIPL